MSSEVASSEDPRILQVLDVIFQLAAGNLEARGAPSDRGDDLDAIVVGVTMLAEEFSALQQETRRRAECLATLNEIARAIAGSLKMDTMLASIADTVQRLIPFDRASVLLLEQDGETMSVFALHAPAELSEPGEGVRLPVTPSIRAIAAARQGVLITDLAQEVSNPIYETLVRQGIRAGMAAPLIAGDRVVGAFNLGACAPGAYRNDHLSLLQAMADQIAPA
ncbi:MAG TPA: hypothetical protein DEP84_06385, partial [Chloroflexi bacterium]|nr:hypothetical protein [Chloroflexota bacterium]